MKFKFDSSECLNLRRSLRKEWLETNGKGDYASSSIIGCNARKYHGLFFVNIPSASRRYLLLSALEDTLLAGNRKFALSTRQHPGTVYPESYKHIDEFSQDSHPIIRYRFGSVTVCKEILFIHNKSLMLIKYTVNNDESKSSDYSLSINPLLAYRDFHSIAHENAELNPHIFGADNGISIRPYKDLPPLFMQTSVAEATFKAQPDWCRKVEYIIEAERGFPYQEDLFIPGTFLIPIKAGEAVYISASTDDYNKLFTGKKRDLANIWTSELKRRKKDIAGEDILINQLIKAGEQFIVDQTGIGLSILAGYHWFDSWGRDSLIALPGLTFCANKSDVGKEILEKMAKVSKDGLVPNCISTDGNHAYNSVDASLWYMWAVQQLLIYHPKEISNVQNKYWPLISNIIKSYSSGNVEHLKMDSDGFLIVGSPDTQLTWMDANAYGKPVTPRNGSPVEISALWYNALVFASELSEKFGEKALFPKDILKKMPKIFMNKYWLGNMPEAYLADTVNENGPVAELRPNQLFALSMPNSMVPKEKARQVIKLCWKKLLTPYGLRTLSPDDPKFCPLYRGGPDQRDSAYHQGTVWPWLLASFGEAVLKFSDNKEKEAYELLDLLHPLLKNHLFEAGIGSISEIFDADPPHSPDGCIAQAWSVAEPLRLIRLIQNHAPKSYDKWLKKHYKDVQ